MCPPPPPGGLFYLHVVNTSISFGFKAFVCLVLVYTSMSRRLPCSSSMPAPIQQQHHHRRPKLGLAPLARCHSGLPVQYSNSELHGEGSPEAGPPTSLEPIGSHCCLQTTPEAVSPFLLPHFHFSHLVLSPLSITSRTDAALRLPSLTSSTRRQRPPESLRRPVLSPIDNLRKIPQHGHPRGRWPAWTAAQTSSVFLVGPTNHGAAANSNKDVVAGWKPPHVT
jgi:hypothetical protein